MTEYILERGSSSLNEDSLVMDQNIFGVFDGATSLDHRTFENGKTGGLIASDTARSVFAGNHYPLKSLAKTANTEILNQMVRHGVDVSKKQNRWSTSAAVIRVLNGKIEWVQTGDAVIILIYNNHTHKVLVEQEDLDHDTLALWKSHVHKNPARAAKQGIQRLLMGQIQKTRLKMNTHYGVLNGEKAAELFLNHGFESLDNVREILLFTDGLSLPRTTPEKVKDFSRLVEDYLALGLDGLRDKIRKLEKKDPFCTEYPRFKCHDDIAAIVVKNL